MAHGRSGHSRRLAAIMAADVAGYSRLMHDDEETTHTRLSVLLADAVAPAIADHGGRIVKNTGDGFLAEFPSAVEAVRSALQLQARTNELTIGDAEDRRIAFRIGINVGDVIVEPNDIFGDSVNIAARLEGIAEPGLTCISLSAYEQVHGKVSAYFVDLGEQDLKNIPRPVRVYAVLPKKDDPVTHAWRTKLDARTSPHLSIVVLPFDNLGGDPAQDYFVDGVTENLTTDLSSISGSFVIGRHTAFTFKGKAIDLKQIGRELNVNYVLEGSVQRSNDRVRVNVQLVDARTGTHLWADRFDKPVVALFDMQDEIVSRLANQLQARLTAEEARRSERSLHPSSMELYFQGRALLNMGWLDQYLVPARNNFERALIIDPKNVEAMVGTAIVDAIMGANWMNEHRVALLARAEATLMDALYRAPNHGFAHMVLGAVLAATKRAAQGIAECERALALDRNMAEAHAQIGLAKHLLGLSGETEGHISEALRLSPRDIFAHRWCLLAGLAKLALNNDEEALGWFNRSIEISRNQPFVHFSLAAALALRGSLDDARAAARAGLTIVPSFTIRRFRDGAQSDNPVYLAARERVYEGMRLAGVPEG